MLKILFKKFCKKLGYEVSSVSQKNRSNDPMEILQRLLGRDCVEVIIDGGASIGDTSVKFCQFFPNAIVHAFEPYPPFQEKIRNKSLEQPRVKLVPFALAEKSKDSIMRVNESAGTNSLLKGDPHGTGSVYGNLLKEKNKLSIKTSSIDDWFTNTKVEKIDILKLDIQGLELEAIKGATETLNKGKIQVVICEIMFHKCYKNQPPWTELVTEIERHGFSLYNFFDYNYAKGQLRQTDGLFFHKSIIDSILNKGESRFHYFSNILID